MDSEKVFHNKYTNETNENSWWMKECKKKPLQFKGNNHNRPETIQWMNKRITNKKKKKKKHILQTTETHSFNDEEQELDKNKEKKTIKMRATNRENWEKYFKNTFHISYFL